MSLERGRQTIETWENDSLGWWGSNYARVGEGLLAQVELRRGRSVIRPSSESAIPSGFPNEISIKFTIIKQERRATARAILCPA